MSKNSTSSSNIGSPAFKKVMMFIAVLIVGSGIYLWSELRTIDTSSQPIIISRPTKTNVNAPNQPQPTSTKIGN